MCILNSSLARSIELDLSNPTTVLGLSSAKLAEALRVSLRHVSPEGAKAISEVLNPTPQKSQEPYKYDENGDW